MPDIIPGLAPETDSLADLLISERARERDR